MKLQLLQDTKNRGMLNLISFNTYPTIRNKPNKKKDSLKVEIKTQPGETNTEMVS